MLSNDPIVTVHVNPVTTTASSTAFDTGLILFQPATFSETKRLKTYTSAADMLTDGFTATDDAYKAATRYFGVSLAPAQVLVSCYPSTETPVQALNKVLESTGDFYGVFLCSGTSAVIQTLAAHIATLSHPLMLFYGATGTPAEVVADNGLFAAMKTAGYRRALGFYCSTAYTDAAAVMGLAMGMNLAHTDDAFALCFKQLAGVTPSALTESQVTAIKALNSNVYITRGYSRNLLENGAVASGSRYDDILYVDEIASDLQNAALTLLADNPNRLTQTDATSDQFIARFNTILSGYTQRDILATAQWTGAAVGSISPGDYVSDGFSVWADSYDTQSAADRAAHKAMPIHVALILAGSVESLVININVME